MNMTPKPTDSIEDWLKNLPDDLELEAPPISNTQRTVDPTQVVGRVKEIVQPLAYRCGKCDGTGTFHYGYRQNLSGKCHACNGKGGFKTSPQDRSKARQSSHKRKAKVAQENVLAASVELNGHPGAAEWFAKITHQDKAFEEGTFQNMIRDMYDRLVRYGSLSEKQWGVVERGMARDAAWEVERTASAVATEAAAVGLDLDTLPRGNNSQSLFGVPGGETRLKIRVRWVAQGKWAGWIFVDDGAEYGMRKNYGKQRPGGTYVGAIEEELAKILADPWGATEAHAKLTGTCARCRRPLEHETSVTRGLGPVCAEKWGAE